MPEGIGDGDATARNHRQPFLSNDLYRTICFTTLTAGLKFESFSQLGYQILHVQFIFVIRTYYRITVSPIPKHFQTCVTFFLSLSLSLFFLVISPCESSSFRRTRRNRLNRCKSEIKNRAIVR